ncbi:MAG: molecular chaperone DnaJ [Minicystis sp.]
MQAETCGVCGGDGRIANSFSGSDARCPSCLGTGRRSQDTGFRDVTKTKPSHFQPSNKAAAVEKEVGPSTFEGKQLAGEVQACALLSNDTKAKLTREIGDHEATHGKCTQTFVKKIRRQLRPPASK